MKSNQQGYRPRSTTCVPSPSRFSPVAIRERILRWLLQKLLLLSLWFWRSDVPVFKDKFIHKGKNMVSCLPIQEIRKGHISLIGSLLKNIIQNFFWLKTPFPKERTCNASNILSKWRRLKACKKEYSQNLISIWLKRRIKLISNFLCPPYFQVQQG